MEIPFIFDNKSLLPKSRVWDKLIHGTKETQL